MELFRLEGSMLDPGEPAATPFTTWTRDGSKPFSMVVERSIPERGSLTDLWLSEWRTWCLEVETLTSKVIGKRNSSASYVCSSSGRGQYLLSTCHNMF